jgi:hypothetical protein
MITHEPVMSDKMACNIIILSVEPGMSDTLVDILHSLREVPWATELKYNQAISGKRAMTTFILVFTHQLYFVVRWLQG